jgi:hypothetical protein
MSRKPASTMSATIVRRTATIPTEVEVVVSSVAVAVVVDPVRSWPPCRRA